MNRTRRRQPQPLTTIESLLLAQAVWEHGAAQSSWSEIAKILSQHPLLSRPKPFFNPQSCHSMYELLLKDADLEPNDLNNAAHAPMNLQLAQKHYHSRFLELRELIMAEELKFKTILREIEEIKVGLRDKEIQAKITGEDPAGSDPSEPLKESTPDQPFDEGLTETTMSQLRESKSSPSPSATHIDNSEDKNETEDVQSAVEDGRLEEEENDRETGEALNQRQEEEEEETHREEEDKEEEEASKIRDSREEEENIKKEEIKSPEEKENQEEMESNVIVEEGEGEESKEETETNPVAVDNSQERHYSPQGQDKTDVDHEQDDQTNLGNNAELDMESESEIAATPAEIPASPSSLNLAEAVDDEHTSGDEPVIFTRRSSRRRKSSATSLPPPPTRKRLRSRGRISELEPQLTVDSENDSEIRDDYPQVDDDQISSPFDGSMARRRDGKRKASFVESAESPPDKKRLREDSEPAEEEDPGPSSHNTRTRSTRHTMRTEEQVALKRFQNVIGMLHSQISQHRNGNIFHNPIKNSEAPDYREIVKRPMDLKTIKTRVKDGVIANSLEFQRDIFLMFANAMMYNRPGSDVHAMAEDMMLESEGQILAFRQTEGLVKRGQRP